MKYDNVYHQMMINSFKNKLHRGKPLSPSFSGGITILVKNKAITTTTKRKIGNVMQTTLIVEQETNDSSAQFPVDQLERYLEIAPAISSFCLTTFLPLFPLFNVLPPNSP